MAKAKDRIEDAKPYVKRAIQDEELRDNLRSAFATARDVYDELIGNRGVTAVATEGRERQGHPGPAPLGDRATCATRPTGSRATRPTRDATALCCSPGSRSGILFNPMTGPETRRWLKDKIFGEDEEFGYGSSSGNGS